MKYITYELKTARFESSNHRETRYVYGMSVNVQREKFAGWDWQRMINKYDDELLKDLREAESKGEVRNIEVIENKEV